MQRLKRVMPTVVLAIGVCGATAVAIERRRRCGCSPPVRSSYRSQFFSHAFLIGGGRQRTKAPGSRRCPWRSLALLGPLRWRTSGPVGRADHPRPG